jgi:hypothetical protein
MEQNLSTRILGRVVAREITAEEAEEVSGGAKVQTRIQHYDKKTGKKLEAEDD